MTWQTVLDKMLASFEKTGADLTIKSRTLPNGSSETMRDISELAKLDSVARMSQFKIDSNNDGIMSKMELDPE